MNIVLTDWSTVSDGDITTDFIKPFGNCTAYPLLSYDETADKIASADAVICNKTVLDSYTLRKAKSLKYIGLFATGYNNIDIEYCREKGITVCNAGSYSTYAVAQHTFAMILNHYNRIADYNKYVENGNWQKSKTFAVLAYPTYELFGKTIGIVGMGSIGSAVGNIAKAFGMNVLYYSRTPKENVCGEYANIDKLLAESDIVTVHCPLNKESQNLFNDNTFSKMKTGAYFVNTARGAVVDENALVRAVNSGKLSGASLDVLNSEPMSEDCPLIEVKNITITPHVAWAPYETRTRLIEIVANNLKAFIDGKPTNVVN